jgi:RNA polymerase sigma factor (TIGR02999 family)
MSASLLQGEAGIAVETLNGLKCRIPKPADKTEAITRMLQLWREGDKEALDRLIRAMHKDLLQMARHFMRGEKVGHSLQATALVNEAYLRLFDNKQINWQDRTHFLAVSAMLMRRILVDHARKKNYQKRGGDVIKVPWDTGLVVTSNEKGPDLEALDDALEALAKMDERKAKVVEMKFFGGMTVEETAAALKVSPDTVMRDWRLAKAWLSRELKK